MVNDSLDSNLLKLKNEFKKFKDLYDLPEFDKLNELFDIEEIDPDTDYFLRKIRRILSEKIAGYLRFVEVVLNPSSAPMFFFKHLKKLENEDRESLTKIHDLLGVFELRILKLDLDYSEDSEASFIKDCCDLFDNDMKEHVGLVIDRLSNGKNGVKKVIGASYFG